MKTLVFADFHLGTETVDDKERLTQWVATTIEREMPQRLVFNGDTFELILPADQRRPDEPLNAMRGIVDTWRSLFDTVRNSSLEEIVVLAGEHDYDILQYPQQLSQIIGDNKKVCVSEHLYDKESKTLVMHGHHLDYNRVYFRDGQRISCIDGLTRAMNAFLKDANVSKPHPFSGLMQKRFRSLVDAMHSGAYSSWYGYGALDKYLATSHGIFGNSRSEYAKQAAAAVRSAEVEQWLGEQHSMPTKALGALARTLARFPGMLLASYRPAYRLLECMVDRRIDRILNGESYADKPNFCKGVEISNLILGHFHEPREEKRQHGAYYNISSPRLHINGTKAGQVSTYRDFSYAVIDKQQVRMVSKREERLVSMTQYL